MGDEGRGGDGENVVRVFGLIGQGVESGDSEVS
jgi:hypothetical protein